jgi:hypothetical protein
VDVRTSLGIVTAEQLLPSFLLFLQLSSLVEGLLFIDKVGVEILDDATKHNQFEGECPHHHECFPHVGIFQE